MAHRLARRFGATENFWMSLQANYDLAKTSLTQNAAYQAIEPLELNA